MDADVSGPRILVLGGSAEGYDLADRLVDEGYDATTSFAGVTSARRAPRGAMRVGGFGGAAGLAAYLVAERIDAMIDATHPYAAVMSAHAAEAARRTGTPRLHVVRPAWTPEPGDAWRDVEDLEAAAAGLPAGARAFLTTGRSEIARFAARDDVAFLARCIDPPEGARPRDLTLIRDKGPFRLDDEIDLMTRHRITRLVTKNSGGAAARPKLEAARRLGIPVLMVRRPPPPEASGANEGRIVRSAGEAMARLADVLPLDRRIAAPGPRKV